MCIRDRYVLVSSFDPLVVYLYDEGEIYNMKVGLVRFATEKYKRDLQSLNRKCVHLTNYSVNKFSENYIENNLDFITLDQLVPNNVSKWNFKMLHQKYTSLNLSPEKIFAKIKDVIIKSLITIQPHVCNKLSKSGYMQNQCFDLFGFDIIIDDTLKPWLLEVNMSPSLSCSSKLDKQIKTLLLCDTLHLIGITSYAHSEQRTGQESKKPCEKSNAKLFNPYLDSIKENTVMNKKDLKLLMQLDEESRRSGSFERIFPLKDNWKKYVKYFECERYNDILLWKYLDTEFDCLKSYKAA
eukprot:TRINITY_DN16737_c0_g1_i5.p1 TRINITY_DN16737_c0_g1~~TRINITY_DN16737_c0_g1_i5.p1  ORF type:complete len:296 (+),score=67.59 TRINITY_DN16737_c0_g1_i5:73-960(+)